LAFHLQIDADPGSIYHVDADAEPDPDPAYHFDEDPDPHKIQK
jgi:hypothetical protein